MVMSHKALKLICIVIGFFLKADFTFSAVGKLALWRPCYPPNKMVQQT